MIAQLRAELLKIRSTRTTLGLVLGMVALLLLFILLHGLLSDPPALAGKEHQREELGFGSLSLIFSALAGVLVVTSEYRFGTIRPTFVFTPRRWVVLGAKVAASLLAGLAIALLGEALAFGIGYAILHGRGIPIELDGGESALLVAGVLVSGAIWGGIGAGLAAILRNQVGSVIGLLVWILAIESLLFGFVPSVGRFMPGRASDALMGLTTDHLLPPAAGGAMLVAWLAALGGCGLVLTLRRDVG